MKPQATVWARLVCFAGILSVAALALTAEGGFGAQRAFAANPSANLDQCANGSTGTQPCDSTDPSDWQNGNLGQSQALYFEGDSVPYRMRFDNLTANQSHTVTIQWDTTQNGKHALDYLTTFNRTVTGADPCASDSAGCTSGSTTHPIPSDPNVTGVGVTPVAGNFTFYNGLITNVSAYTLTGTYAGSSSTAITLTFTPTSSSSILAWGGHISTRKDWGANSSAVAITGSPYHTRLLDLDGSGGNQDRSLSADAVIFPGSITIIKDAIPDSSQSFGYTTTSGTGATALSPSTFNLVDNGTTTGCSSTGVPNSANTECFFNLVGFPNSGASYTISETTVSGYTLSFANPPCTVTSPNGGTQTASSSTVSIALKEGENVTCTFTNTLNNGTLTVNKVLSPSGDPGKFDLQINGTTAGTGANVGNGGTTGAITEAPGSYTVGEIADAGSPTPLTDYTSGIVCKNGTTTVASGTGSSLASVPVGSNQNIVCTITNTRNNGTLKVNKVLSPNTDLGKFDLQINSTTAGTGANVGDGGTTGAISEAPGSYTVGEIADASSPTPLTDYTSSISCKNGTTTVASGSGTSLAVNVDSNQNIVCTITNTRIGGTLTVNKVLSPNTDPGTFDLQINGTTAGSGTNVGDGGTTGAISEAPGSYTVGEIADASSSTPLTDYTSGIVCKNGTTTVASGTGTSLASVPVDSNQNIVCTITNTRNNGTLTVNKVLSPNTDPGKFDLQINSTTAGTGGNVGDGGTTGAISEAPGSYTAGEVADASSPTPLTDYTSSIVCKNGTTTVSSGSGTSLAVSVDSNQNIVCTITNTRNNGTLTVNKVLSPNTDPGKFDLQINSTTAGTGGNVGDGGTTGAISEAPGSYTVGEIADAGSPTPLTDYTSGIVCKNGTTTVASGTGTSLSSVPVDSNQNIVCTITNTRNNGTLKVNKVLNPNTDLGTFDLQINSTTAGTGGNVGDGGTTGAISEAPGSYTVGEIADASSPTPLTDYTSSIVCKNGTTTVSSGSGTSLAVSVDSNQNIVCTITNTRNGGTLTVNKVLSPNTDPGKFDLQINSTTAGSGANVGDGGTTGAISEAPGSYTVGEIADAGSPKPLTDYTSGIVCKNGTTTVASGTGTSLASVPVDSNQNIVCTITNTRNNGTLKVNKVLNPNTDPGTFDLQINGTTAGSGGNVGDGGTTGAISEAPGSYTAGEIADASSPTPLTDYTSSISCKNGTTTVASGSGTSLASVPVDSNQNIVCTITNTRNGGTLTVNKVLSPNTDPGTFDLQINGTTAGSGANVGDGGTTGAISEAPGSYTVGEIADAGSPTPLTDYTSGIVCKNGTTTVASGTGTSLASVPVDSNQNIVCTITNTRNNGTLTVNKVLSPNTDPGKFDLQINSTTAGTGGNVGDGGTTGAISEAPGSYTVSEIADAGSPTPLTDYTSGIVCKNGTTTVSSGSGTSLAVSVDSNQNIVCTITNTRNNGTLTVNKTLNPNTDPGKFDLQINSTTAGTGGNVGDGGTTGAISEAPGSYAVGEIADAGSPTPLTDYTSSILCKNGTTTVASGSGTSLSSVPVDSNQNIVCTITNTRNGGTLKVNKVLSPNTDPGKFDLQINSTTAGTGGNVGDGGTTGAISEAPGSYTVGEIADAGSPTPLTDYTSGIVCKNGTTTAASGSGTSLAVSVDSNQNIVCTITNTRNNGTLKVNKTLSPNTDPGTFDLQINGTTAGSGANVGDGGTTGAISEAPGSYTVGEIADAGSPTPLTDYTSGIVCKNGTTTVASGTGTSLASVPVDSNQNIVCTITNTRNNGTLTVNKTLSPNTDPGKFDLQINSITAGTGGNVGDGGTTGAISEAPGSYTVGEIADAGSPTPLTDYTSGIVCKNGTTTVSSGSGTSLAVSVDSNQNIVCTITNTRNNGTLTVIKVLSPNTDPGKFDLQINSTTAGTGDNVGDGGTTGAISEAPGSYTAGEIADASSPTPLTDYTSGIVCKNGTTTVSSGSGTSLAVSVDSNQNIVCTITNTRNNGTLKVIKSLSPNTDPGKFDLQINGTTAGTGANVGDGGTTGAISEAPGSYTVGEIADAGSPTPLTDYTSGIVCKNGTTTVASGTGTSLASVPVDSNQNIVCTITNTRNNGTLTVNKVLSPNSDAGKFDLQINGTTAGTGANVGDGGTTGAISEAPGSYTVGEIADASSPTALTAYTSGIVCKNGTTTVKSGSGTSLASVSVDSNQNIVCTITNTRNPTGTSQLAPTQTTCSQFAGGTAPVQSTITYAVKGTTINSVSPGVFFYYSSFNAPSSGGSFTVTITQSNNGPTSWPNFKVATGQSVTLYDANCNVISNTTGTNTPITITVPNSTANQLFIVGIKFDSTSIKGASAKTKPTVTYTFGTVVGPFTVTSSTLKLQPSR